MIRAAMIAVTQAGAALHRWIFDSATDFAIIATDPQGRITAWSAGAERVLGWAETEMLGEGVERIFTPEDREAGRVETEMTCALETGVGNDERWHLRKDGERFWANGQMTLLRDDAGEVAGFVKVLRDRTEQHLAAERAEKAVEQSRQDAEARLRLAEQLREAEAYSRLLLASTAEGFYAVDRTGVTTLCNPAFVRMMGFAGPEEAVGRRLHDAIHHHHPDGSPHAAGDCPIYRCASEGVAAHVADDVFFRLDGQPLPVEYWATPIVQDGELKGAICTFLDITDRKHAEAEGRRAQRALHALNEELESRVAQRTRERDRVWQVSRDLLGVCSLAGVWRTVNPAWTQLLGWEASEIIGRNVEWITHPDDIETTREAVRSVTETHPISGAENRLRTKAGDYRALSWTVTKDDGALYCIARDVTELRAQATALERVEDQLRQAQKMEALGQLTGGIAHDFNNLLTGVIGSLDIVRRRIDAGRTEDLPRFMDAATTSAQRAAALTHRLLAFARRQSLDSRPTDVNALVAGLEELMHRTLGEAVSLKTVMSAGLWPAMTDANQLENAILNLAINARDAMPDGGQLTIETANTRLDESYAQLHPEVAPGEYVVICVTDTGVGMTPAVAAKAFDPFFTTKPIGAGTGLGLSMIYGFAKQSGGHVRIYSELGEGTTFKLYLPRADVLDAIAPVDFPEAPRGRGETVLVVEDDATVRLLVMEVLEELGYQGIEAADARSAIPVLQSSRRIDLLVTDVGLPNMNGRQLAEIARQARPGLRILFVTGYAEQAAFRGGFLEPGMDMMTKPFALDALASTLRELLER